MAASVARSRPNCRHQSIPAMHGGLTEHPFDKDWQEQVNTKLYGAVDSRFFGCCTALVLASSQHTAHASTACDSAGANAIKTSNEDTNNGSEAKPDMQRLHISQVQSCSPAGCGLGAEAGTGLGAAAPGLSGLKSLNGIPFQAGPAAWCCLTYDFSCWNTCFRAFTQSTCLLSEFLNSIMTCK